jgi:hypothetical protein
MAETNVAHTKDIIPIGSRVSWGAIFAGGVISLAAFLLLTLLGGSIGLSIADNVTADTFGTSASIWAICSTVIALFVGGYITSQCAVGENVGEAVIHGLIMWGVVFAFTVWLTAAGVRAGFNALIGVASVGTTAMQGAGESWESMALKAGIPQERINELRQQSNKAQNTASTDQAADVAMRASWWTLFGVMLSMAAAAIGAYLGAGPRVRVLGVARSSAMAFGSPAHGA